jgi:ribosomal protein S18 acetylase RimI-like enzyme
MLDPASDPVPSKASALSPARSELALVAIRELFLEYQQGLGIDLCFQGFEHEVNHLPGEYEEPMGGLFLAQIDGQAAGCCAFRPLHSSDHLNACEMKRLFVRPGCRGRGLGRQLVDAVVFGAQQAGYTTMLLDTLTDMETARALYQEVGFVETEPYYHNPIAGAHYLKLDLRSLRSRNS